MNKARSLYIIANTHPVEFGGIIKAPGFRAHQYFQQAAKSFANVKYILFEERLKLYGDAYGTYHQYKINPQTILIPRNDFAQFVDQVSDASFLFTQPDFVNEAYAASLNNVIYYDILAPKNFELLIGKFSQKELDRQRIYHEHMIKLSSKIFVNGPKTLQYFRSTDDNSDFGCLNNFVPIPKNQTTSKFERKHIFFGGTAHKWINNTKFLFTMHAYLKKAKDVHAFFLTPPVSLQSPSSREISMLSLLPNVTMIMNLTLQSYLDIINSSFAFLDVAESTIEREYATSTRVLQAIYSEVPVFHQVNTGLDEFWPEFPGFCIEPSELSSDSVDEFVVNAKYGAYSEALRQAQIIKNEILQNDVFA